MPNPIRLLILTMASVALVACSREEAPPPPVPERGVSADSTTTRLEAFSSRSGSVLVKDFEEVGTLRGLYGSSVEVRSMRLTRASGGQAVSGMVVDVSEGGDRFDRSQRSFVDADELDGIEEGVRYLLRIEPTERPLDNFEATFTTRGDLKVTVFTMNSGEVSASINSGSPIGTTAFVELGTLSEMLSLVSAVRSQLDSLGTG